MSDAPELSIILITYNMRRETPRTLQSLLPEYQEGVRAEDYEVIVVENGSPEPLDRDMIASLCPTFSCFYLTNPPPSPAHAINFGVGRARGRIIAIMIDGACLLTPGVLRFGRRAFRTFDNPVVMTRYFYLGPAKQNLSMADGYDRRREDELLAGIGWPSEGYRLFEIGIPLPLSRSGLKVTWFSRMFESTCLFMTKQTFERMGGADERFDIPGGGFLNMDMYREAARLEDTEVVQLLGEGTFHQLHGGTTTNISIEEKERRLVGYREQYRAIRGEDFLISSKPVYYLGHMPNAHAAIKLRG